MASNAIDGFEVAIPGTKINGPGRHLWQLNKGAG